MAEIEKERVSLFEVTEKSMRPSSTERRCFFCLEPIGEYHLNECVLVRKKIKVRMTVEYIADCPASWDGDNVEFRYNESSWCANNAIDELKKAFDSGACMCNATQFEYLGVASAPYLEEE